MIFRIRVIPNARKTEIVDRAPGFLKIKLTAPARGGKANKALVRLLGAEFNLPKSAITIIKGEKGWEKIVNLGKSI